MFGLNIMVMYGTNGCNGNFVLCSWINIMPVLKNGHGANGHGIEQMVEMWFGN